MPAKTKEQRTLFCIALAIKKGDTPASYSAEAARMAKEMTKGQLREYCEQPVAKE